MNKKIVIGVIIILAIVLVEGAVAINFSSSTGLFALPAEKEILIGVIQPLTGNAANFGQSGKAALLLAQEEINSNGGINGNKIKLIFEDSHCSSEAATTAAQKLIEVDRVSAIIGGNCSSETLAIAPIAEKAKVLVLSNGSSSPAISDSGDYIFRDYPSDSVSGKIAAEYAYNVLGARSAAILYWQSNWPMGIKKVFKETFENLGGKVILEDSFSTGSIDMKTQLTKIKNSKVDVVYFLAMTTESLTGVQQAKQIGLETQMIGGEPWDDQALWDSAKDAGEGKIFVAPKASENEWFINELTKQNTQNIPGAAQAYDALKIIANAITKCGTNGTCEKDYLYAMPEYNGISGKIQFDSKGDLKNPLFTIKKIENGKIIEVADAS
ncbi:MAG: ABC transporter substrate-binding protein [archaeon]|jgi:branched-chain amino acid transport system substrate-binding protein